MRMVCHYSAWVVDHVEELPVRFKLFLEPHALRDQSTVDPRLPSLPVSTLASIEWVNA